MKLNAAATLLVSFVIVFHLVAFALEVLLWMQPGVHEAVLPRINPGNTAPAYDQALALQNVLVNQGFYNLFLAGGGIAGLVLVKRGDVTAGSTLISFVCLFAVGAGVTLALSTRAYTGAFLQAIPAVIALRLLKPKR